MNTSYFYVCTSLVSSVIIGTSFVFADDASSSVMCSSVTSSGSEHIATGVTRCLIKQNNEALRQQQQIVKSEMNNLRQESQEDRQDFHSSFSGEIRSSVKSLTGSSREIIKDIQDQQKGLHTSLSGASLEEKIQVRSQIEDLERQKIEVKFAKNPDLLAQRLAVYDANKARREIIVTKRLEILLERSVLRSEQVDLLVKNVQSKIGTMTDEQKIQLSAKLAKQVAHIQLAKNLSESTKNDLLAKLDTLKQLLVIVSK